MTWKTRTKGSFKQLGQHFQKHPKLRRFQTHRILTKSPVRNAVFRNNEISLFFDNEFITNDALVKPHVLMVASWSPTKGEVYIDNNVPKKYHFALAVHESIEKYLWEKYGLDPNYKAHELADKIEKNWFVPRYGEKAWEEYSKIVEKVFRLEHTHHFNTGQPTIYSGQTVGRKQ